MKLFEKQFKNLNKLYQGHKFDDAEKLALSLTEKCPKHPYPWKVLGVLQKEKGQFFDALYSMQQSVDLAPKDSQAHFNLGVTLKKLGRLDDAEASYAQAIILKPDFAQAHYNLGNTLARMGRLEEAEASYAQAIFLKPDFAQAHNNLGDTLKQLGRLDEAEARYSQAIQLKPESAEAHNNLGVTLKELGRLDEAEACYVQAIALKPDSANAYYSLGNILRELDRLDEAEERYSQAIHLKPEFFEAHNNLGVTLKQMGKLDEAKIVFAQVIAKKPNFAEAYSNLGNTLKQLGRLDEAEERYSQAIKLKPEFAEAHRHLSSMKSFKFHDEQYLKMQELHLDGSLSEEQRCHINFGLAKACEDLGNFKQAYKYYNEGNMLRKKQLNYDIHQDIEIFNQIKYNYQQTSKISLEKNNLPDNPKPIFIVGMPRSGTSLAEQIISSHPQIIGAGELPFVGKFGGLLARGLSKIDATSLLDFRTKYLKKLQKIANDKLIVTDKMPQNFRFIGLITAAFPEAKIVHVKRNPAAVCWANYKQYFISKNIGFCYSLEDVAKYHMLYENLMEFWESSLSQKIYQLNYELLVESQESETKKLIDYLGLDWDEKCLSPEKNKRSVATASNIQIRKKVYQGSSQQWKKYEPFLNGALDDNQLRKKL
jgi:tetratricopeptide (TPR) repeat protein